MKIEHTEWLSHCDTMQLQGMSLWLTPGSDRPYWASQASFKYDQVVATPWDFLAESPYTAFDEDHDYVECDEQITIEFDGINPEGLI